MHYDLWHPPPNWQEDAKKLFSGLTVPLVLDPSQIKPRTEEEDRRLAAFQTKVTAADLDRVI